MKKLFIVAILFILTLVSSVQFQADTTYPDYNIIDDTEITYEPYNTFSDYYFMRSDEDIDIPNDTEMIDLRIPSTDSNVAETGGTNSTVRFSDADGDNIGNIKLTEIRSGEIGGERYLIDLERYDVEDAETFIVDVAQDWNTIDDQYSNYYNDMDTTVYFSDEIVEEEGISVDDEFEFENENFFSDTNGLITDFTRIPVGAESIIFNLPDTTYNQESEGGLDSYLRFYNYESEEIDEELLTDSVGDEYSFEVPDEASFFRIRVMQSYEYVPGGYVDDFNENTSVRFNEQYTATYYVDGEEYETDEFLITPSNLDPPDDAPEGKEFYRWEDDEGVPFNFNKKYTEDIDLYAYYGASSDYGEFVGSDPSSPGGTADSLHTVLADFNMDSSGGNTIFTIMVLFIVNAFLMIIKVRGMAMPIVNMAVLAVLYFGGFVPFWVMLALVMVLGLMFISMRGGMQRYE